MRPKSDDEDYDIDFYTADPLADVSNDPHAAAPSTREQLEVSAEFEICELTPHSPKVRLAIVSRTFRDAFALFARRVRGPPLTTGYLSCAGLLSCEPRTRADR